MDSVVKFIVAAVFAPIVLIFWWEVVTAFWQSDDMRLAAIVLAVAGIAAIAGTIYGLYKKFANGGW